jgi:hypothetical protein
VNDLTNPANDRIDNAEVIGEHFEGAVLALVSESAIVHIERHGVADGR